MATEMAKDLTNFLTVSGYLIVAMMFVWVGLKAYNFFFTNNK